MANPVNYKPVIAAGTLMGIGMGGFVDGIVFHQIFQLHSMLSANLPQDTLVNVKTSMVWDGLFHLFTWIATAISVKLLWNAARHPDVPLIGLMFSGSLIVGWGVFNLVEGLIDHHFLEIHYVVEVLGQSIYDYLFLASGVLFIGIGYLLIRKGKEEIEPTTE